MAKRVADETTTGGISVEDLIKIYRVNKKHGGDGLSICLSVIQEAIETKMSYAKFTELVYADMIKEYGVSVEVVGDVVEYSFNNGKTGAFSAKDYDNYTVGALIEGTTDEEYIKMFANKALYILGDFEFDY